MTVTSKSFQDSSDSYVLFKNVDKGEREDPWSISNLYYNGLFLEQEQRSLGFVKYTVGSTIYDYNSLSKHF